MDEEKLDPELQTRLDEVERQAEKERRLLCNRHDSAHHFVCFMVLIFCEFLFDTLVVIR